MILVTGGTGLVGSHLLYHLALENDSVKAIHRKNSDLKVVKKIFSYYSKDFERLFDKIEWIEADITDVCCLEIAFENVTHVYHSAALVSFNAKDYKAMRTTNIDGTANVVNLCIAKSVQKLCFVSSIATIEKSVNGQPITEENEWNIEKNNYGYAITKNGAEMEVWRASQEGVPVVIVNPGVIIGAGFWNDNSGAMFSKIYKGLKFYSEGVTGFVGVNDVAKIMMSLMESSIENERYILVAENVSFKSVFDEIATNFNVKKPTIKVTKLISSVAWRLAWLIALVTNKPVKLSKHSAKAMHNKHLYSSEKVKNALNYQFEPISTTIKVTCEAFKCNIIQ